MKPVTVLPPFDFRRFDADIRSAANTWTQSGVFSRAYPDGIAIFSDLGNRSFAQLEANANRIANQLRSAGLAAGDPIVLMCGNRPEFIEVLLGAMRTGLRLTPISTHLNADEARYIVHDCRARLVFVEEGLSLAGQCGQAVQEIRITGLASNEGVSLACYGQWLDAGSPEPVVSPAAGTLMLYTSGTTGRPKGVFRKEPEVVMPQFDGTFADYQPGDTALCCGPAYHAAPLLFDIRWPLASGVPIVLLQKWDSERVLVAIQNHRISHAHMVPTMFQRLLRLPTERRLAYDVSSLRLVIHGAAPCPVHQKKAMIDWLGPILIEYYGATEGGEGIHVDSLDWLRKPGTVGKIDPTQGHSILDDEFQEVTQGAVGRVFFRAPATGRFVYFGDPQKTAEAYRDDRFTMGDMGYVDADGYLFLTGRSAECIISGGVNIYPSEVDDVLARHPCVRDACTVGAPDDEWGEKVVSVVILAQGQGSSPELAQELIAFAAQHLAAFKRPRQIVFDSELPYTATGKLMRNQVRKRFWANRDREI
nr:AMP-binding protein [Rhodoferax sp.]